MGESLLLMHDFWIPVWMITLGVGTIVFAKPFARELQKQYRLHFDMEYSIGFLVGGAWAFGLLMACLGLGWLMFI